MLKLSLITVMVFAGLTSGFTQPDLLWSRTYNQFSPEAEPFKPGKGKFICETPDGGFIVTGYGYTEKTRKHFLAKTDSAGEVLWHNTFREFTHHWDCSVEPTTEGGYIVGGGGTDAWLMKFNALGEIEWDEEFGGYGYQFGCYAQETADGGYIIVGGNSPTALDEYPKRAITKLWLIKTDSSGNTIWEKKYGGDAEACGFAVRQTKDNGYIAGGTSNSEFYLLKTDSLGNVEWEGEFKGSNETSRVQGVQQTLDGGFAFAGWSSGRSPSDPPDSENKSDIHLFKTDPLGKVQWHRIFNRKFDTCESIQQTRDGGFIIAGNTCDSWQDQDHDIWIIKTDSKGAITWERTIGGDYRDRVLCIQQTADGGYVLTGHYGESGGENLYTPTLYIARFKPEAPEKDDSPKLKDAQPSR